MRKIFAALAALIISVCAVFPAFCADEPARVTRDFTVLYSEVKDGATSVILVDRSDRAAGVMTLVLNPEKFPITASDEDGDEAALRAFEAGEPIPAGTGIRVSWNGYVDESYPGGFGEVYYAEFVDELGFVTYEDAERILSSELGLHADKNGLYCAKKDFTVVGSLTDERGILLALSYKESYPVEGSEASENTYFTTVNLRIDPTADSEDVGGCPEISYTSDGSVEGDELLETARRLENIPLGTVIEVAWDGLILESYPPDIANVIGYKFTCKKTDFSFDEIANQCAEMNEMRTVKYEMPTPPADEPGDSVSENPDTSGEIPDVNPKTGVSEFVALGGILAWVVSVAAIKK